MSTALLAVALLTLVVWLGFLVDVIRGRRWMTFVRELPVPEPTAPLPRLSVIVPARNEAETIEPALRSLLAMRYPDLEVIVVDDRSEDGTAALVGRIVADDPRARLLRVRQLPPGWLGKNHALQLGADAAGGDWLLFTDADVVFGPHTVARIVAHMLEAELDHLTLPADVKVSTPALELFVATFALTFNAWFRPWTAGDPSSRNGVGFGSFNLVRTSVYRGVGGHRTLANDPIDDVRLGEVLKASGARQRFAIGGDGLSVEWYPTLGAAIRGLEKNTLAAANWSVSLLLLGGAVQLLTVAWPYAALLVTRGPLQWINAGIVATLVAILLTLLRETGLRAWTAAALPLGVLLVQYTYVRAAWLTIRRGGIEWRGTFYPLAVLRRRPGPPDDAPPDS